jgi:hypothetical protein
MTSTASKKVAPIEDEKVGFELVDGIDPMDVVAPDQDDGDALTADELNLATILKRATRRTYYDQLCLAISYITYDNAKEMMRYMLESASCTLTLSVWQTTLVEKHVVLRWPLPSVFFWISLTI